MTCDDCSLFAKIAQQPTLIFNQVLKLILAYSFRLVRIVEAAQVWSNYVEVLSQRGDLMAPAVI
jgi:hypothetical protein